MSKPMTLKDVEKDAKTITIKHKEIKELRARVLPVMRETIKQHMDKLQKSSNPHIRSMADKVYRGYFGTDMKSEQLEHMLQELQKEVSKLK